MDLVVGGGKYGTAAAGYLRARGIPFVLVDPDPCCAAAHMLQGTGESFRFVPGGINEALRVFLSCSPDRVFPAAPVHVAAEMVSAASGLGECPGGISALLASIPTGLTAGTRGGSVFLSLNRDSTCLPECPSPELCPVTGEDRTFPLHEQLRRHLPDAFILESVQVAPGLGAVRGPDLMTVFKRCREMERATIATACRCHGVVTVLVRPPARDSP